jgi:quinol monooxygenase YgiN
MLIVSGTITVDPSGTEAALELARPLVEATLAEEGCITYGFWTHPDQPGVLRVYEEWESDEAMVAHFATPHMAAFMEGMGSLPITGTSITRHVVAESSTLM